MRHVRTFDHVGITDADLDAATAFFVALGLEVDHRTFVEAQFLDTVVGIGEYEGVWRMAYVRGREGVIVSLTERCG